MKKWIKRIIFSLFGLILLAGIALCVFVGHQMVNQLTHLTDPQSTKQETENFLKGVDFDWEAFEKDYSIERVTLESSEKDHAIPVVYFLNPSSKGFFVLTHYLGGTKESVYPLAERLIKAGYSFIAYDQRNSGDNTGSTNTFGFLESQDLLDVVNHALELGQGPFYVWGASFGGGTVALAAPELEDKVQALILDSPMSNGKEMTQRQMEDMIDEIGLPMDYLLWVGDWGLRFSQGFSFGQTDGVKTIRESSTPLMVIHAKNDEMTPYHMGEDLYQASAAKQKELWTLDQGEHAMYFYEDPDLYLDKILAFLADL